MAQKRLKRLKAGELAALALPLAYVDLIIEHVSISEHLLSIIYAAKVRDDIVRIKCSLDDLDQLSNHVINTVNSMKDNNFRDELCAVFEAIRNLEQSYYGAKLRIVSKAI